MGLKLNNRTWSPPRPWRWIAVPVWTAGWIVAFAGLMWGLRAWGLLPAARPVWDMDQAIVSHQAGAAVDAAPAELLLLGDSSCLMDVDAGALGEGALNLATLSYLSLDGQAMMLEAYLAHHDAPPETVVLLMHPESLRRRGSEPYFVRLLAACLEGRDPPPSGRAEPRLRRWLGLDALKARVLSRWLPRPLPPSFRDVYGTTRGLLREMDGQQGGLVQPGRYVPGGEDGNAAYRWPEGLDVAAARFRAAVPATTRLVVGVTPVPESHARADHPRRHRDLLDALAGHLQPDQVLDTLPATAPDDQFGTVTHLNHAGRDAYTRDLVSSL